MNKTVLKVVKSRLTILHFIGGSFSFKANVLPTKKFQKNKFPLLFYAQPYQFDKNNKGTAYTFVSIKRYSFTTNVLINQCSHNGEFLNK